MKTSETVIGWVAWYDTGGDLVEFSSLDTDWADLPGDGLIEVKLFEDAYAGANLKGRQVRYSSHLGGYDYVFRASHPSGDWVYGGTSKETPEEIKSRYPGAVIKRGKWVPLRMMRRVERRFERRVDL